MYIYNMSIQTCKVCQEIIAQYEYDMLTAFTEISPLTFHKANFHAYCYSLEIDEAKMTPSKKSIYSDKYDAYLSRDLSIIHF